MKIKIQVGQPKGFDAGDGTNVFIASVVEGLSGSREVDALARAADVLTGTKTTEKLTEHWLVLSCSPIKYMDSVLSSILLIPKAAQNDGIEIGGMFVANAEMVKE
ncbi:MAG: hypothetical protein HYV23_00095 [Deltaproteobacteria bacterium]|nr:hypothetical protein [Deltaproteobacteria bacterium]